MHALALHAARVLKAATALVPAVVSLAAMPARAMNSGPYALEVLVDGRPLAELYGNGRTYVEATANREYSLRLTNNTARRVAIAVSVDGLNTIDARTTTPRDGSKWILEPYQSILLDGWQTSSALARHFYFTSEKGSYGAWLGKTDNLGVIAAAVFRERRPPPDRPRIYRERDTPSGPPSGAEGRMEGGAPGSAAAPPPPAAAAPAEPGLQAPGGSLQPQQKDAQLSEDYAATGIGREVDHEVEHVRFRAERSAAAMLEIRYEYRPALVSLGLLPRVHPVDPLKRRERAHGFEPGFAPDPYCRHDGT